MKFIAYLLFILAVLSGCATSKKYNPSKKYSPDQLRNDYSLFRHILEESHPSLYWYTPKDSIDYYFDQGYASLTDSMPEYKFRLVLSHLLSKIQCGHTTIRPSPGASKYAESTSTLSFPLNLKLWQDTAVITSDMNKKDSFITRGTVIRSINGKPMSLIVDTMFRFLSADGFNLTHKYQTLSNPGMFRGLYASIYGLQPSFNIDILESSGALGSHTIKVYNPYADSSVLHPIKAFTKKQRKDLLRLYYRNFHIFPGENMSYMDLNTFTKGNGLRSFFKKSFRSLKKQKVKNLVIDIRSNGGGSVVLSNLLTRYLVNKPFKIADSLYAIKRKSTYGRYIESYGLNRLFLLFLTHRRTDGFYHFTYYENKYFRPLRHNHFNGNVYILTGGNTFSAAALFAKSLKNQSNVTIVGEETGGGSYGNTAWLIPEVTLPNTKVRFRLPLFRLVIDKNEQRGRGVLPDVETLPTVKSIEQNKDFKMDKVRELIKQNSHE